MKKYSKNRRIILLATLMATSISIAAPSYGLESDNSQIITERKSSQYYNYKKQNITGVTNEKELRIALENPNIEIVEIKNNINIMDKAYIDIKGNEKEIKGNGYTIAHKSQTIDGFYLKSNTKIDNLKIDGGQIYTEGLEKLEIVNNSELNNFYLELGKNGLLENSKVNNSRIYASSNSIIKSSKIKNTYISVSGYKNKDEIVKITNTEIDGSRYFDPPIRIIQGNIELENIKITNPGEHAIRAYGHDIISNIRIKGILEIDGAKDDAIVLEKQLSSKKPSIELYIDGDIKQKGDTYTINAEEEGTYTKVYYDKNKINKVVDKGALTYYSTKNREGNEPNSEVYSEKLAGETEFQTAVKVSNKWKNASDIVIVNSKSIADALSAAPFAKWKNAPILLTEKDKLNSETKQEILRLGAKNIHVIGGESLVSNAITNELKSMNLKVNRVSGNDRYETSLEVAKKLTEGMSNVYHIAVVNGVIGLPDAVSIAPVAGENRMPIVLVSPNEGSKVFDKYIKDMKISKSYIIGNQAAISNEIAIKLPNPERLGGIDRNETNAVIVERFYILEKLNNIFVAKDGMKSSSDLIDALVAGVLAAKEESPVVIVGNKLNDKQKSIISKKQPNKITQIGANGNENAFNELMNMFKN